MDGIKVIGGLQREHWLDEDEEKLEDVGWNALSQGSVFPWMEKLGGAANVKIVFDGEIVQKTWVLVVVV